MALSEGVYLGRFMIIIVVIVILWFEMSLEGLCWSYGELDLIFLLVILTWI